MSLLTTYLNTRPPCHEPFDLEGYELTLDCEFSSESMEVDTPVGSALVDVDMVSRIHSLERHYNGMMSSQVVNELMHSLEGFDTGWPIEAYTSTESMTLSKETWDKAKAKAAEISKSALKVLKASFKATKEKVTTILERNANSVKRTQSIIEKMKILDDAIEEGQRAMGRKDKVDFEASVSKSIAKSELKRKLTAPALSLVGGSEFSRFTKDLDTLDALFMQCAKLLSSDADASSKIKETDEMLDGLLEEAGKNNDYLDTRRISSDFRRSVQRYVDNSENVADLQWVTRDILQDSAKGAKDLLESDDVDADMVSKYLQMVSSYTALRYQLIEDVEKVGEFLCRHQVRMLKMIGGKYHDEAFVKMKKL